VSFGPFYPFLIALNFSTEVLAFSTLAPSSNFLPAQPHFTEPPCLK
jgi:hypothetical protein